MPHRKYLAIAQMFTSAHMSMYSSAVSAAQGQRLTRAIILGSTPDAPGHMASIELAASCGVGTSRLQRPSIRAGFSARHPMLSASFDDSWKAQRRRPHLYDGLLRRPGISSGRLHQHPDRGVTLHRQSAYPSLSTAPAGKTPVSRKRQSAMSNLRATATIPIRLKRLPPPPKRSRNQHTQGTVRLKAQPTPRQLRGHPAHMPVAGLGDPLFPGTLAALIRRRREAR